MKKIVSVLLILAVLGCARVNLQTAKPLKVDVNMRVDIYQHVAKDVASIEDQVYGLPAKKLNQIFHLENAYAEDDTNFLTPVIDRRKARMVQVEEYFSKGYIGESQEALLSVLPQNIPAGLKSEVEQMVRSENEDRQVIYTATANKNGMELAQVKKIFFEDHYKRAPAGYWFQVYDKNKNEYVWQQK